MFRLTLLLLGVGYLRKRSRALLALGLLSFLAGVALFFDALDGALGFPLGAFAVLLLLEGLATLTVVCVGVGGQRVLRAVKGTAFVLAAGLVLAGHHHGHVWLSMIFGALFLADGLLQSVSAWVVRFSRWRWSFGVGLAEIAIAIFFFQPYPTHYVGTVPYCLGLGLMFAGWNMVMLARRARRLPATVMVDDLLQGPWTKRAGRMTARPRGVPAPTPPISTWAGPPGLQDAALTVHVWTPAATAKAHGTPPSLSERSPIHRYIAAVDANGVISTGHAALEAPGGIYVSLYPAAEIDRDPAEFGRLLRATRENDVAGVFQRDYRSESQGWCPSTVQVRIRNYDPSQLRRFWHAYRQDTTYNLTDRNCASSVARALEAAVEGACARLHGADSGWWPFIRLWLTPELWIAMQIRKRARTMAWTPGLVLDYARALSMLVDPRPFGWTVLIRRLFGWMVGRPDSRDATANSGGEVGKAANAGAEVGGGAGEVGEAGGAGGAGGARRRGSADAVAQRGETGVRKKG